MRIVTLLGTALLLCAALSFAQDSNSTSSPGQTSNSDQNNAMSGNTVQGCLSGTAGSYMLTDATGVTYQLQGDDSQFSANANKEVEVMGTLGATASASNAPDAAPGSSGANGPANGTTDNSGSAGGTASGANANAAKTLTVTSMHKVADSCPASQTPQQ